MVAAEQRPEESPIPSNRVAEIRLLYRAAILLFLVTIVVGMLNGMDLLEFERPKLMTHVHAGTLGWITLTMFAFTIWLFPVAKGGLTRVAGLLAVAAIPFFLAGFWFKSDALAATGGATVLVAILGFTAHATLSYRAAPRTTPRLAIVAALLTLTIGSTVGVLIASQRAIGASFLSTEAIGAHVGAQVVGYLVLMGMALAEWRLLPGARLTVAARAQVGLLFVGGLLTSIGALLSNDILLGLFIPLEVSALVIFVIRVWTRLRRVGWRVRSADRHFGLIVPFLVANVILLTVLIGGVVSGRYADFELIPSWLVFAFDHAMFIGVMTNGILGLGIILTSGRAHLLSWCDHVAFWGINSGLIGFVIGMMFQSQVLKRVSTPIMGTSILLALLAIWVRLQGRDAPFTRAD